MDLFNGIVFGVIIWQTIVVIFLITTKSEEKSLYLSIIFWETINKYILHPISKIYYSYFARYRVWFRDRTIENGCRNIVYTVCSPIKGRRMHENLFENNFPMSERSFKKMIGKKDVIYIKVSTKKFVALMNEYKIKVKHKEE